MRNLIALSICLWLGGAAMAQTNPPPIGDASAPWRNVSQSPDARARDLLPRLTLQEKISLLHADGTFSTPGLPRFNIPKLWMSDGPQGVREEIQPTGWNPAGRNDDFATALPAGIGLAASFDPDLAREFGQVIGEEARARGKHIMLCPGLNIMRTPLNGRNSEYFGEDPYLASRMAVGFINGVQSQGVAACAKHFALNNQETNRDSVNVKIDERTMREIYLPAFKAAVTEARVWTIMTGYNRVNGQYCSENDFLLNRVLKSEWNFQGLVMSDWGGVHSTVEAAKNGSDLEMGSNVTGSHDKDFFAGTLLDAVNAGTVPISRIDDMVLRNLRVMASVGLLNSPPRRAQGELLSEEHLDTARRLASSACVLLKNSNNALPINPERVKTIAVIGQNADTRFAHDGNSAAIKTRNEITPLQAIRRHIFNDMNVTYAQGYAAGTGGGARRGPGGGATQSAPATNSAQLIDEAVDIARNADVAIVVAGLYRAQDQEGADRPSMNLPPGQAELIAAVAKANPKTVVVLTGGSPSVVEPWISDAAALLMYWYGGTEGGTALANVLFGDWNPSGHLPCTWPKKLADSPAHNSGETGQFPGTGARGRGQLSPETGPQEDYSEGLLVGYRWFDEKKIEPQFPFGFGLSYTTFAFSNLNLSPSNASASSPNTALVTVNLTVTNSGTLNGGESVQIYIAQNNTAVPRPPKELKALRKVTLQPGERRALSIPLPASAFTHYDTASDAWIAEPGDYTILVGNSSRNLPLKATYRLDNPLSFKEGS